MKLPAGSTVKITPASPFFPTCYGKVSEDGSKLILPPGISYGYSSAWDGYKSAEGPVTGEGDPTWTRWDFDPGGEGRLWECLPCHVVFEFAWEPA